MAKRDQFTPATSKFVVRKDDEPVIGWVSASVPIERGNAPIQRAVVISEKDRELLKQIRDVIDAEPEDAKAHLALLDRLIGKR